MAGHYFRRGVRVDYVETEVGQVALYSIGGSPYAPMANAEAIAAADVETARRVVEAARRSAGSIAAMSAEAIRQRIAALQVELGDLAEGLRNTRPDTSRQIGLAARALASVYCDD